jgi:hypothetical protein
MYTCIMYTIGKFPTLPTRITLKTSNTNGLRCVLENKNPTLN